MKWKRPDTLEGYTICQETPCGNFYLTLNHDNGKLVEVRMLIGKSGNCMRGAFEMIAILISTMLQSNIDREKLAKTLEKVMETDCGNTIYGSNEQKYDSCIDFAVKKIVEELLTLNEVVTDDV